MRRAKGPRAYLWSARVTRKATTAGMLRKIIDRAFDGSARRLVAHLLEDGKLSAKDQNEIRRLLDESDRSDRS